MDILKREIAPITAEAWQEIDDAATDVLKNNLTARSFVDVVGPLGWEFSSISKGRLTLLEEPNEGELCYGIREIQPVVESRVTFNLSIWELDNITRGEKAPQLDPLEDAVLKIAQFEEQAIYHGLEKGNIAGLNGTAVNKVKLPSQPADYIGAITKSLQMLKSSAVDGPYTLVLPLDQWEAVLSIRQGYPLDRQIINIIGGDIIPSDQITDGFLLSTRGGDFQLTLGIDFSIGYEQHNRENVKLFIAESFTFNIVEPKAFVKLEK